jgi:hypothetical protein
MASDQTWILSKAVKLASCLEDHRMRIVASAKSVKSYGEKDMLVLIGFILDVSSLARDSGNAELARNFVRVARTDYESGRTVDVEGIIVSRAEVSLIALASRLSSGVVRR